MNVFISVPAPIVPVSLEGKPLTSPTSEEQADGTQKIVQKEIGAVSLHRYLMTWVINEVTPPKQGEAQELKIGNGYAGNKRIRELDEKFKDAKAGDLVAVDEETIKAVRKIVEEKNWAGLAIFSAQLVTLEYALMNAVPAPIALKSADALAQPSASA